MNEELMRRSGMQFLSKMMKTQPEVRLADFAMNWTPKDGKRSRERPQKTWRMTFFKDLRGMGVT